MGKVPLPIVEIRNCKFCGASFDLTRRQQRKNKIYCSKKCAAQVNGKTRIKNRCNCLNCDKEFLAYTKKNGRRKLFCSPECRAIGKGILKVCGYCRESFKNYQGAQYCSRECYDTSNAAVMVDLHCSECGKTFQRKANQAFRSDADPFRKVFCSPQCFSKGTSGKKNSRYLGDRSADRGPSWKKQRKKALKGSEGLCYFCSSLVKGKEACVDHIIPFRLFKDIPDEGLSANDLINLWVLCRPCHTKKTMIELDTLYSDLDQFEEFVDRTHKLSDNNVVIRIRAARVHWFCSLAKKAELGP